MGFCGFYYLVCIYFDVVIYVVYFFVDYFVYVFRIIIEICIVIIVVSFLCFKFFFKILFDGFLVCISGYGFGYKGYVCDINNGIKSGNRNIFWLKGIVMVIVGGNDIEFELYGGKKFFMDVKVGNVFSMSMGFEVSIFKEIIKGNGIIKIILVCVFSVRDEEMGR